MSDLPRITAGSSLRKVTARQWDTLVRAAEKSINTAPGHGIRSLTGGRSLSLSVTTEPPTPSPRDRWVVIVEEPTDASVYLLVRPIRYRGPTPVFGKYDWDGLPFVAYPPPGQKVADFTNLAYTATAPPTDAATVLRASFERFFWFLQSSGTGGSNLGLCHIVSVSGLDVVTVQFLKPEEDESEPRGYRLTNDGDAKEIKTWPTWLLTSYQAFVGSDDVFMAVEIGGFVFLLWQMRLTPIQPPTNLATGNCP